MLYLERALGRYFLLAMLATALSGSHMVFGQAYPSDTTITANPNLSYPYSMNPYVTPGFGPPLTPPNLNSYLSTDRYGNLYPFPNPNNPINPIIQTPMVPKPNVPTPIVPNLNLTPNAPMSPGSLVPAPVVTGPYGSVWWDFEFPRTPAFPR
jgi:hypothetical protein